MTAKLGELSILETKQSSPVSADPGGAVPIFEDVCVARDPMLVRRDGAWALYYTRCASTEHRVSGVAYRLSRDLVHWSEPRLALSLADTAPMPNSGFTESPFVFQRNGYYYLSVSSYPIAWDATVVMRCLPVTSDGKRS